MHFQWVNISIELLKELQGHTNTGPVIPAAGTEAQGNKGCLGEAMSVEE